MRLPFSFLIFLSLCILNVKNISAHNFSNETLNYKVTYKWGIIHKQAGTATIKLTKSGNWYKSTVTARSDAWADRIYRLRDTLMSTMRVSDLTPTLYERIAHEDGKYAHDIVNITRNGDKFSAKCTRQRRAKKATTTNVSHTTLEAQGTTVDLLSSFYYLRALDFDKLTPGHAQTINIFSGKRKELLKITYHRKEVIKIEGKKHDTYKITFTFTSEGKKKTSEPIEAWVETTAPYIPLKLVGKLKIGQIQCFYIP